jgi:hypothetical protein
LNFIKFTCIFHISLINLVFNMTVFYFTSKWKRSGNWFW